MGEPILAKRSLGGMIVAGLVVLFLTVAMLLPAVTLKAAPGDELVFIGDPANGSDAGRSVALLDINGDGFADLVVGDPFDDEGGYEAGKVTIYLGNDEDPIDTDPDVEIIGSAGDRFGWAVAFAGRVNGDNNDDLIVGAPNSRSGPALYAGKAFIFFGYADLGGDPAHLDMDTSNANVTMVGSAGDELGYSVSTCGDLNGDAHDEVIVGAVSAAETAGEARIYYGDDAMDNVTDKTFVGPTDGDKFGWSVAGGVNLDGDTQKDIAVGAPGAADDRGAVMVILNPAKSAPKVLTLKPSSSSTEAFGEAVALVDINSDQYGDVAVGAPHSGVTGKVYVFYGSSQIGKFDTNSDIVLSVGSEGDEFGTSLAAGDPWTDSIGDLVVGAPYNDEGALDGGCAYVFFGNSSFEDYAEPDIIVRGDSQELRFGASVASGAASVADFDDDGAADFAVGAPDYGGYDGAGAAYVYLGEVAPVVSDPIVWGYVKDSSDSPLDGAFVLIESGTYSETFTTIANGSYGLAEEISLRPGVYVITASYDDYFSETVSDVDMILGEVYREDFVLTKHPVVSGVIDDGLSPGDPLQGVLVQVLDESDVILAEMTTGPTGEYEFILPYKDIEVRVKASIQDYFDEFSDPFTILADAEYLDKDLTIHHKPVLLVKVEDAFLPGSNDWIEGAEVVVTISDVVVATGTTDENGEASMTVDGVGDADVAVTAVGYVGKSDIITLEEDQLDAVLSFSLERQPAISGRVSDKSDGMPISGAEVERFDSATDEYLDSAVTGPTGIYLFEFVAVGTYDLRASAIGYVPLLRENIAVVASQTSVCDFSLNPDSVPPVSSATGIDSPDYDPVTNVVIALDFTVTAEASDTKSDIEAVVLYWRHGETGQFTAWDVKDYEAPYEFEFTAEEGDGVYSFYTVAKDCAGNVESPPADGANDTWVRVVSGIPASFVEEIVPYEQDAITFTVTVTSDYAGEIVSVELFCSFNGGVYDPVEGAGTEVPCSWDFVAPYGDGVYSFYSIVTPLVGPTESAPDEPDTSALVDTTKPTVTISSPTVLESPYTDPEVTLSADAEDTGTGLAFVGYKVDSDDDVIVSLDGEGTYDLEAALSLADGTHTILVWAEDVLGWESVVESVTFDVDTTKPVITITYPVDGDALLTDDVLVTWTVDEEVTDTKIRLDGQWSPVPDGETSYLYSDLANDEYTVTVNVTDLAGHQSETSSTFWVDDEPPDCQIADPGFFATSSVTIQWFQEDLESGIKTSEVKLDDGDWETADTEVENVEHTFDSVSEGTHTVFVRVTDEAGNEGTDDATFEVDGTPPLISVDSPYDGEVSGTDSVEFDWSITDGGTGINPDESTYKLDVGSWQSLPGDSGSMTLSDLSEGTHTLLVHAMDLTGNEDTVEVQFTVDTEDPDVSISYPAEDEVLTSSDVEIVYTADGTGSGVDLVEMSVNGGAWEEKGASPISLGSLSDGDYTVELRVTDEAGHEATAIVNFTVDAAAPEVTITDAAVTADSVTVIWTVDDQDATVEVQLDGGSWQLATEDTMTFSDLADGDHTVIVRATDAGLNEGSDSVTFTVDTTPPTVSITSPSDGATTGADVTVEWTADDGSGSGIDTVEVRIDGGAWVLASGSSHDFTGLADGDHTVDAIATDLAGNPSAIDSVTFTVDTTVPDTTAPVVTITEPVDGATLDVDSVDVSWVVTDEGSGVDVSTVEYSLDAGAWTSAGSAAGTVTLSGLSEGTHTFTMRASDLAGNDAEEVTVTFTVMTDSVPPTVSITSPASAASLDSSTVTVTWTASDGTGSGIATTEVKIDDGAWTNVTGSSHEFTGLADGAHGVSVRVTDNAGNDATASVTFMVDTVDPDLDITGPEDGMKTEDTSVTVTWTCTDVGCGIDRIEVCIDGGSFTSVGTDMDREFSDLAVGEHTVDVRAYDKAGNMVQESVTFEVTSDGGGISALVIAGIVLAIIIVAALAVMLMRRRKKAGEPPIVE